MTQPLPRRLLAELLGSAFVAAVVIGAGIGAYIGAAYFFTSSTSFANPAITFGRMFSNTFAGIAPASVPSFAVAQIVGGAAAILTIWALYPDVTSAEASDVLIPQVGANRAQSER